MILRGKQAHPIDLKEAIENQIKPSDSLVLFQKQNYESSNIKANDSLQKELPI
jgi:hypothetical protein